MKTLPTQDMFGGADSLELPTDHQPPIDTAFITALYLLRATSQQGQTMAQWFAKAHGLKDADFAATTGSQATKIAIINKGYNMLPLSALYEYNKADNNLNQRRRIK